MFLLHGIDALKKVQAAGVFAVDDLHAGELAVRPILTEAEWVGNSVTSAALNIGNRVETVYTVPLYKILELTLLSVQYSSGGAISDAFLVPIYAGMAFYLKWQNPFPINSLLVWDGRLFFLPSTTISSFVKVTANGAIVITSFLGVLHPTPT